MALIICPECKRKISDTASSCPSCGYQLAPELISEIKKKSFEKQKNQQWNTPRAIKLFFLALNWTFALIFLFAGLLTGSVLGGSCLIAISLLLLPPIRNYVYSKTNKKIHLAIRAILIFILFMAFGLFAGQSEETKEQTKKGPIPNVRTEKLLTKKKASAFKQGDLVNVGYTSYVVTESWWATRLGTFNEKPDAMFLMVGLSVCNKDTKARTIPPFFLVDQLGREYETSSKGWAMEGTIGSLDTLNPNVEKTGGVIFDVPKDNNYKLKVSGGYWSDEDAFIELSPRAKH